MKAQDAELFASSLHVFKDVVSPAYDELRRQLNNSLSNDQMADLVAESRSASQNFTLLSNVVSRLPLSTRGAKEPVMLANNPYEARQIQANMLWTSLRADGGETTPFYVVGQCADTTVDPSYKEPRTNLLLCKALGRGATLLPDAVCVRTVWDDEWEIAQKRAQLTAQAPFEGDQLQAMFDHETEMLRVTSRSDGIFSRSSGFDMERVSARRTPKKVSTYGIATKGYFSMRPSAARISNEVFVAYDVPTGLNTLATIFGVTDILEDQLAVIAEGRELPVMSATGRAGVEPDIA